MHRRAERGVAVRRGAGGSRTDWSGRRRAPAAESPPGKAPANSAKTPVDSATLDKLLDMADKNPGQLSEVHVSPVTGGPQSTNLTAPSSMLTPSEGEAKNVTTTSQLIQDLPSVTNRRISGLNVDASVRGYDTAQINASANGMPERRTVQDVDSLFSQIDPGLIENMTVIDGPYSSLYGPGFAFLTGAWTPPPRYEQGPESHLSSCFEYGSNGQTLYTRDNVTAGSQNWGVVYSYGFRVGNDYRSGGSNGFLVPSSYQKWDSLLSSSFDTGHGSRIEFDCLRNEMNNVLLPGVVFDLNNSVNNQFNLRYVVQADPNGPEQFVLQTWYHDTSWNGDASREEKQQSMYYQFVTLPFYTGYSDYPVDSVGTGTNTSVGVRALRTFGEADAPQWTVGADWRRYQTRYQDTELDALGDVAFDGNLFGVPRSRMDDVAH